MPKMVVNEFAVGKTVAENIYSKQGVLLIAAGNPVTPALVKRLSKDQITFIWVR